MYKIIGADGREYGPVSADQLRQWITEGRVNADTQMRREGDVAWMPLGTMPEFTPATGIPANLPVAPQVADAVALKLVRGPAIILLVLSLLDILASLMGMVMTFFQTALMTMPNLPHQNMELQRQFAFLFSLPANAAGLVIALICLWGSVRMMNLRSYGLAMTAAVLMLLPCGTCCCCVNVGAAIWALVVLSKPEVKAAFR
ncbi:MAG: DUF4339 domain-containing protein [Verrucomicrobiota bacterium]|nr:DUF4339 domain-containing protein [Limisphaerales bacterium]